MNDTYLGESVHWRRPDFWAFALTLLLVSKSAGAAVMESIEFSSMPGDKTEIRITFDAPPPEPTGYTIEQPARIALDLAGVTSVLESKYHPLGSGNARSVTVIEAGDRTRVIVAMTELVAYSHNVVGNTLYVLVGTDEVAGFLGEAEESVLTTTEEPAFVDLGSQTAVQDIDFRRGDEGEGRVMVTLSNPGIGVDVSTEGGRIRVEFEDAEIPSPLRRRLDVTDFATPVLVVDALPEAGNTVLFVEATGDYDYLAYQTDNLFTLEVKPLTPEELETTREARFKYTGEKLSLNFQDIEIRSVLQLIADFTELNLVASESVAGTITLRLKNVPWDQALDIILKTQGLDQRQMGNVLRVAPADVLAAQEKLEAESKQQISELAPLRTEFIEVKYAKAAEIYGLFQQSEDGGEGVVSQRGSVIVDERTNSIILTETTDKINAFREVLDKLDVPVRQVLIEARIVVASSSFSERLGVRWGGLGTGSYNDDTVSSQVGASLGTLSSIKGAQGDITGLEVSPTDDLMVDFGVGGSRFSLGLLKQNYLLELELSAAEAEGQSETIARPKVITADKQTASVSSGVSIPYQEASSSGATSTSFIPAVLSLSVTPQITPDDRIIMELQVTQDEPTEPGPNGIPGIATNQIQTNVLVSDGETIVLGGIFRTSTSQNISKTPFFGDLPYVGRLFRQTIEAESKQELLIFVTPRLLEESLTSR